MLSKIVIPGKTVTTDEKSLVIRGIFYDFSTNTATAVANIIDENNPGERQDPLTLNLTQEEAGSHVNDFLTKFKIQNPDIPVQ